MADHKNKNRTKQSMPDCVETKDRRSHRGTSAGTDTGNAGTYPDGNPQGVCRKTDSLSWRVEPPTGTVRSGCTGDKDR